MKFYIDFDHTLYNTNNMVTDMIDCVAEHIFNKGNFDAYPKNFKTMFPNNEPISINKNIDSIVQVLKDNFKRPEQTELKIKYNIFSLIDTFACLFNCDCESIKSEIYAILQDGKKYLYDDSTDFLKYLKDNGHEVYILSHEKGDLKYQETKVKGSGIFCENYVDCMILTKAVKANLTSDILKDEEMCYIEVTNKEYNMPQNVDYKNGIFIDDRPKDLEAYYKTVYADKTIKKIRLYRIARLNQTYTDVSYSSDYFFKGIISVQNLNEIKESLLL